MPMPKKPENKKRKPTGVSLEAGLLKRAQAHVQDHGYTSLSALITELLREAVQDAADAAEAKGQAHVKAARAKLRRGNRDQP
jgi:metal-responsive CopG/Arc/MetJ family transcriptional regulator